MLVWMRLTPRTLDDAKVGIVRSLSERSAWAKRHPWCQLCGGKSNLHTHHIAGAAGRSDEPCNWLRVCQACHDAIHENRIRLATVLAGKLLGDSQEFNLCRVLRLKGMVISVDLYLDVADETNHLRYIRGDMECPTPSTTGAEADRGSKTG